MEATVDISPFGSINITVIVDCWTLIWDWEGGRKDERFDCLQDDQMLVFMYSKSTNALCLENVYNLTKWNGFSLALQGLFLETVSNLMKSPCKMEVNLF